MVFVDDVIIYSASREDHAIHLRVVLELLREHYLYAKLSKCEFWLPEVKFLGHVISQSGISVDPGKVDAVSAWPRPQSVFDIRSFLGGVSFWISLV